ncbi:regulator of G-protein signaling 22 [Myripristis murdjan]|uniref:regulator of G-protein signaling 22 n=1 Tax=Myripristis murdjan TaxID=586833 RepID=UPI001175D093|nr:regulator of G-protein signaling 22 [Myripristis murdjan]
MYGEECCLASDNILVHFFNDFLSLPSFPEALLYNPESGVFEVVSEAAECVSRRIRSVLHRSKSQLFSDEPTELASSPPVDNRYTVCCLGKEQGIQWIMNERFPLFIQSDCYFEYRLAKLLYQWEPKLCVQRRDGSSGQTIHSATRQMHQENNNVLGAGPMRMYNFEKSQKHQSLPSAGTVEEQCLKEANTQEFESSNVPLEYLAANVIKQVIKDSVKWMEEFSQANTSDCSSKPGDQGNCCTPTNNYFESEVCRYSTSESWESQEEDKKKVQEGKKESGEQEKTKFEEKNEMGTEGAEQENALDICYHGTCFHGSRQGLDKFKEFLWGTPGEKLFCLWMDIERLKATQHWERKNRHLVLMRSRYLLSSSPSRLNVELLSRLGLSTSPCWTDEKLRSVQPCLTEALVFYWAPRFWMSQGVHKDCDESPHLGLWTERHLRPAFGRDSLPHCISQSPLRPHTRLPRSPNSAHTQLYSSGSMRVERMLQALCVDSRAGLYFTHFCEQSGNQLWENAVSLWTELQHYRQLFYQDGLDAYQVQRRAQLLYSTYLCSSARRSVGVEEEMRREVYDRLTPAFEELFDGVGEHCVTLLLEPWTLMLARDKESYQQVCVQEEVRRLDSAEYRELQSLYEESELRLKQEEQRRSTASPSPCSPSRSSAGRQESESWSSVPPCYRGYRLGSLLRHRNEIRHFLSFLQKRDASVHLTCWLDLEQYRRTPHRDKALRQQRSSHIADKYLSRKYFFGPDSPASAQQQSDITRLAGGLERLKLERLSRAVVEEIQQIVRSHIERTWLPQFLATAEFTQRQKHKPQAADRLSGKAHRRHKKSRESWKVDGLWMSSFKEILAFRRILLNPVTCLQFQHFVSTKGEFLENDVLFWLEVQRYKDLCHSHSDEATVQQKISTIISCFLRSSVPPALQVDIPPEQAQHILENRHELGPYIFREAQMSVFSELLKLWPQFQALRSSVQEEQLLPLLKKKGVKHRARLLRQRRREEEEEEWRRAQEELERQESSYTEDEEEEDEVEGESEGSGEKELSRRQSTTLFSPKWQLSWSYSKYMAALMKEEALLRRQSQPDDSLSTASDSSSGCSQKSAGSKCSQRQATPHSLQTGNRRNSINRSDAKPK